MKTDALNRRIRFAEPSPRRKTIQLNDADFLLLEAIDRHGHLPTHYLYEFQKDIRRGYINFQKRLTELYNGDAKGGYLSRPTAQFDTIHALSQHMVYGLTPRAKAALAGRGTLGSYPLKPSNDFVHNLMGACVAASLELHATDKGLLYIPREQILQNANHPLALPVASTTVIPDDLFGLGYEDGSMRMFAVEIDRNNESITRSTSGYNTFSRKIENYLAIMRQALFEKWLIRGLSVLTVTTNATHARNLAAAVLDARPERYAERFLFQTEPTFGTRVSSNYDDGHWRMPEGILTKLLDEPFLTPGGWKDISKP